jgi:hypothetical protein
MSVRLITASALTVLWCVSASAAQYTYNISATFNDRGTVSGNVTFDNSASPPTVVSANFATTRGRRIKSGQTYSGAITPQYNSEQHLYHYTWNENGTGFFFDMSFKGAALSEIAAGDATVPLATLTYKKALGQPLTSGECDNCSPYRVLNHGSVITLATGAAP